MKSLLSANPFQIERLIMGRMRGFKVETGGSDPLENQHALGFFMNISPGPLKNPKSYQRPIKRFVGVPNMAFS